MYKGTISPNEDQPKAKIEKKKGFSGIITPVLQTALEKFSIKHINKLNGEVENKTRAFNGSVKGLNVRFTFIAALARFFNKHSAKADTAPAIDLEADGTAETKTDAPLLIVPVSDIRTKNPTKVKLITALHGYVRAGCRYVADVPMTHLTALYAALGVVLGYAGKTALERTSKLIKGAGAVVKSHFNKALTGHGANGDTGTAQELSASDEFTAESTATAVNASGVDVAFNGSQKTGRKAVMNWWFMPEQNGNRLKIFQPFSAIQTGNRVAIDMETESAYWANAHLEGNRLKLVFAETATQTDNRLEVR